MMAEAALVLLLVFLVPVAVCNHGSAGAKPDRLIALIFGVFRAAISAAGHRRGCEDAEPEDAGSGHSGPGPVESAVPGQVSDRGGAPDPGRDGQDR